MTLPDKLFLPVTLAALLGCGIMAGIFFAFSAFMMKAFARLPAPEGISAMRAVNVAILNPLFLTVFLGTAAASVFAVGYGVMHRNTPNALYLIAGGLLYLAGVFLVTALFNVPLNDALERAGATDSAEAGRVWAHYLTRWTAWNHVRTVASIAAVAAFALSLYHRGAPS